MTRQTWAQEEAELQDPATWNADKGFVQPGNPSRRAIVSVPFARDDFAAIVQAARRAGLRTSEFIREAAIERARGPLAGARVTQVAGGAGLTVYTNSAEPAPIADSPGLSVQSVTAGSDRITVQEELAATS